MVLLVGGWRKAQEKRDRDTWNSCCVVNNSTKLSKRSSEIDGPVIFDAYPDCSVRFLNGCLSPICACYSPRATRMQKMRSFSLAPIWKSEEVSMTDV